MSKKHIFISHSHEDEVIARALVDALVQAGIDASRIVASSSPKAQIHTGAPMYEEIRSVLSDPTTMVIFLLSENFYSSTVCMNEMGAAWIMGLKSYFMVLPGFSFEQVNGVITEKNPVGISLSNINDVALVRLNELYCKISEQKESSDSLNAWSLALQGFIASIDQYKKKRFEKVVFSMDNVHTFCIDDLESDGCRPIHRESSVEKTVVKIDFSRTTTKLSSIVYTIEQKNWASFYKNGKMLYFEAYCDGEPFQAEVELHMADRNEAVPLLITDDKQTYRIPLSQFTTSIGAWSEVTELCFLFRKKYVDYPTTVYISQLCIDQ